MKNLDLSVFPTISKNEWLQLAQSQLKGENPFTKLRWNSADLEGLLPYYDASDTKELNYLTDFFHNIQPHRWKLYERIKVKETKLANQEAIMALMGGCDGIIFQIEKKTLVNGDLLKDIDAAICDVSIFDETGQQPTSDYTGLVSNPNATNCLFQSRTSSPVAQITELILGSDEKKFIHRLAFTDFFLEVASIRALRYLLEKEKSLLGIHIHTEIPIHTSEENQWFLNTTAGLASILGGSHSIDLPTALGDPRITRNIGNLIRDESGIHDYSDQCGGSYYVESLTDMIIQMVKKELAK